MDCKTARLLLDFARPQANELQAEEAGALQGHLDHCPDCHGLARGERQLDEQLGNAMSQVEVPAGLRDQLLARLEVERGDWYRRRFAHAARLTIAAAAAVFLLGWAGWWVIHLPPAPIDPSRIVGTVNAEAVEPKRARTQKMLKRMGVETPLSPNLNYNLLIGPPGMTELPGYPGRRVPFLLFGQNHRYAWVYLVAENQVPADVPAIAGEGTFKLEVLPANDRETYRFLAVHDGDNLDWLHPPEPPAT
ncbi:MAG TPA: hypothetical protein VH682_32460 [Gemmataceae bacterium]|jgi:hypothetical protein